MSKADTLVKKAAFYEKLALYEDRNSFLKALAQQSYLSTKFGPETTRQLESVIADLSALGINDPSIMNTLNDARDSYSPFNKYVLVAALNQALAKLPQTPEHATQLENLKNLINKIKSFGAAPAPEAQSAPTTNAPSAHQHLSFPSIPIETQDQLNKILVQFGKINPLKLDGKLGPDTQNAIKIFKEMYNKPGTPQAIKEIYLQVANPELVTKTPF